MKLCIDPGHGMGNKKAGVYDSGCVGNGAQEADIVLDWAEELRRAVEARGIQTFMIRRDKEVERPVLARAELAHKEGCTHLISIHVNDFVDPEAHGTETLYYKWPEFAREVHHAIMSCLNLHDRGLKYREDLAVLKFKGPCCLIELGFIKNPLDFQTITSRPLMLHAARAIAQIF